MTKFAMAKKLSCPPPSGNIERSCFDDFDAEFRHRKLSVSVPGGRCPVGKARYPSIAGLRSGSEADVTWYNRHQSMDPGARSARRGRPRLYGIPITLVSPPSRKPMGMVAILGGATEALPDAESRRRLIDRNAGFAAPDQARYGQRPRRNISCWIFSCWPSASDSSRCRSPTPTPANAFEENDHDF